METIMYILAGILTGGLIAYLFFNNKLRKLAQEIALLTQKTLQLNEKQEESQQRVDRLNSEKNTLQQHNILLQVESEKKSTEIQMLQILIIWRTLNLCNQVITKTYKVLMSDTMLFQ